MRKKDNAFCGTPQYFNINYSNININYLDTAGKFELGQ